MYDMYNYVQVYDMMCCSSVMFQQSTHVQRDTGLAASQPQRGGRGGVCYDMADQLTGVKLPRPPSLRQQTLQLHVHTLENA